VTTADVTQPEDTADHGHYTSLGVSNNKLALWAFIGSECLFFGALISTYLIYLNRTADGPTAREIFDIPFTSVSTFVLLISSLAMVLGLAALQRDDRVGAMIWLTATALLGTLFLGGQYFEFTTFYREGVWLDTNLFGPTFFVLTGFHGTHVTLGVIWLLSLVTQIWRGELRQEHSLSVEIAGLYWHFVDVVWIVIFTVIYLIN
jgi:cytochrome c oxidase subunit 3/cytochrome o ubiquinol oxidase subunit 3